MISDCLCSSTHIKYYCFVIIFSLQACVHTYNWIQQFMSIKLLLRYTCACTVTAGDISDGLYRYTEDLLALKAAAHYEVSLPSNCCHITSPLKARVWERLLATHPDRQYANFIVNGIQRGFCIGCSANRPDLRSATRNMLAAYNNSSVINIISTWRKSWSTVALWKFSHRWQVSFTFLSYILFHVQEPQPLHHRGGEIGGQGSILQNCSNIVLS